MHIVKNTVGTKNMSIN